MRTIQVINQSTVVGAAEFAAAVAACQQQVTRDFAPRWGGLTCRLFPFGPGAGTKAPAAETIYVLDDSDQAGALGYHELTQQGDVPVGFVFARTGQAAGDPWQTTLSHELLEQLADPYVATCAVVPLGRTVVAVAYEVADPVEADAYQIDGVPVSNFVLPSWFQPRPGAVGPFDYLGKLKAPLTLTKGGYVSYTTDLRRWKQETAKAGCAFSRAGRRLVRNVQTRLLAAIADRD